MSKRSSKLEEKGEAVYLYLEKQQSLNHLGRQFIVDKQTVHDWIRKFEKFGPKVF